VTPALLARVGLLLTICFVLPSPSAAAPGKAPPGVWPLDPRPAVISRFDPPDARWGAGHRGVDLSGRLGQRVRSALGGRVSFAGTIAGRGVVVVDHGDTRTTYEPVAAVVAVGDRVAAGATIGRLTLFGSHCFPRTCLHWGLIEGRERYLDPLTLVGAGPVRLLPLGGWTSPAASLGGRALAGPSVPGTGALPLAPVPVPVAPFVWLLPPPVAPLSAPAAPAVAPLSPARGAAALPGITG
jgi:murein DD-endopeptidase MepM/ murein hydrolase activator NlpD